MTDTHETNAPSDDQGPVPPAPRPPAGPAWRASLGRIVRQPRFVAAAAVLLISAVGLNAATELMQLHFRKVAVPLPIKALDDEAEGIPAQLGPWLKVRDDLISSEVEETLGTKQYVFRDYVDTRVIRNAAEKIKDKSDSDRRLFVAQAQADHPEAVMRMAVTYYTGLVDTVAHIPDRCYVADGFEPSSWENPSPTINFVERTGPLVPNASPDAPVAITPVVTGAAPAALAPVGAVPAGRAVPFRFINFDDQTAKMRLRRNVSYLFHVNGEFLENPLHVRARLQNLLEKHGYYAKVELMTSIYDADKPTDNSKALGVMKDFLTHALPEVEARLPDWQKVKAGAGK